MAGAEIRSWGSHAERFARLHATAIVAAVFTRSLHLAANGDVICIGDASVGDGPLNAIVDAASWQRLAKQLPAASGQARLNARTIAVSGVVFSTDAALRWNPPPWPRTAEARALAGSLDRLAWLARLQAPSEGLVRVALGLTDASASALHRVAQPRLERFRQWTSARLLQPLRQPAPVDLLGLGPGLTPSGDDLLCGTLVALHAIARTDVARDLSAAIDSAPAASTSLLARAFLRAAGEGQGPEPLHALVLALLENRHIDRALATLSRVGHTSGWDALAGVMGVLQALVAYHSQRSPQR